MLHCCKVETGGGALSTGYNISTRMLSQFVNNMNVWMSLPLYRHSDVDIFRKPDWITVAARCFRVQLTSKYYYIPIWSKSSQRNVDNVFTTTINDDFFTQFDKQFVHFVFLGAHVSAVSLPLSPADTFSCICYVWVIIGFTLCIVSCPCAGK